MQEFLDASLVGMTFFVMLIGLGGLIVPIFPGLVVIWLAALGYGVLAGFETLGIVLFVFISLLMIAGSLVDNLFMGAKARQAGASWGAIAAALVAGVAGTLIFPPLGGLITAPLGILVLEYLRGRDLDQAWNATRGLALGCGWGFVIRFLMGVVMVALWGAWVFWG